ALEDRPAIVVDQRRLTMKQRRRTHDLPTKDLADALVAEADAEQRHTPGEMPDHVAGNPRFLRRTWPGGDDDFLRGEAFDLRHGHLIVAVDPNIGPQLT